VRVSLRASSEGVCAAITQIATFDGLGATLLYWTPWPSEGPFRLLITSAAAAGLICGLQWWGVKSKANGFWRPRRENVRAGDGRSRHHGRRLGLRTAAQHTRGSAQRGRAREGATIERAPIPSRRLLASGQPRLLRRWTRRYSIDAMAGYQCVPRQQWPACFGRQVRLDAFRVWFLAVG
jgi:hypothetical protein